MPVDWPPEYDRTPAEERKPYPHRFKVSRTDAFQSILDELSKMDGVTDVQLSFGAEQTVTNPNRPYADATFDDPGVVVRFERAGEQYAMPCDRWDNPRDNARAIALTIEAKRALTRYGVETIESEFQRLRLPSGTGDYTHVPDHEVLGVERDADADEIRAAFRAIAQKHHPDSGDEPDADKLTAARKAKERLLQAQT